MCEQQEKKQQQHAGQITAIIDGNQDKTVWQVGFWNTFQKGTAHLNNSGTDMISVCIRCTHKWKRLHTLQHTNQKQIDSKYLTFHTTYLGKGPAYVQLSCPCLLYSVPALGSSAHCAEVAHPRFGGKRAKNPLSAMKRLFWRGGEVLRSPNGFFYFEVPRSGTASKIL